MAEDGNKGAIVKVTIKYAIVGDVARAIRSLSHAYSARQGRVESISSSTFTAQTMETLPTIEVIK